MEHKDNWKNQSVFDQQLQLNLTQISSPSSYPEHWGVFLAYLEEITPQSILDIGCGVGIFYKLLQNHYPNITYTGVDYSIEAINVAKQQWGVNCFFEKDLWDLNKDWISQFDLLHLGALLDVLPNGDEALEFILSLEPQHVLIGRMDIEESSSVSEYEAYNLITTYKYKHSWPAVSNLIQKYNYQYSFYKNTLYLKQHMV
jgi:trans-aconitate methyltransferase